MQAVAPPFSITKVINLSGAAHSRQAPKSQHLQGNIDRWHGHLGIRLCRYLCQPDTEPTAERQSHCCKHLHAIPLISVHTELAAVEAQHFCNNQLVRYLMVLLMFRPQRRMSALGAIETLNLGYMLPREARAARRSHVILTETSSTVPFSLQPAPAGTLLANSERRLLYPETRQAKLRSSRQMPRPDCKSQRT